MPRSFLELMRDLGARLSGRPVPQRWKRDRSRDHLDDYRILWRLEGEPCEVYLFGRWAGYSHPVVPCDSLTFEGSLHARSLCRAYVRELGGEPLMVRFACHAAHDRELATPTDRVPGCYALEGSDDDAPRPGAPLDRSAAAMSDRLLLVKQGPPGGPATAISRTLNWVYSFEYEYDGTGALQATFAVKQSGRHKLP